MEKMSSAVNKEEGRYDVSQKKQLENMERVVWVKFKYSKLPIILAEVTKRKRH